MEKRSNNNLTKGKIATNIAINWFLSKDYTVYEPVIDIEKIDFIARKIFGGRKVKPAYFEIQVKSCRGDSLSFYVPRQEGKEKIGNYFYVFVHVLDNNHHKIYLMTQKEVMNIRYKNTRQLKNKQPKQFEKGHVVVKIPKNKEDYYDINNRKDLLRIKNDRC